MADIKQKLSQKLKIIPPSYEQEKHIPFNVITKNIKTKSRTETPYALTFENDFKKYALWREMSFKIDGTLEEERRFLLFKNDKESIDNALLFSKIVPKNEKEFLKIVLLQAANLMEGKKATLDPISPPHKRKVKLSLSH